MDAQLLADFLAGQGVYLVGCHLAFARNQYRVHCPAG